MQGTMSRREFVRLCGALVALPLAGCAARARRGGSPQKETQTTLFAFDTVCVLGGVVEQAVLDEARAACERYERLFSRTIASSDVARVNAAKGGPVEVDADTTRLVRESLRYCEESDGLFDITIGAVSELWDFANGVVPTDEAISKALPHVGWEGVEVGENVVRLLDPEARIDLGGIAKGYIADRLIELFEKRGVTSGFVNLGGNVKVLGAKADGTPWGVGVRDPGDEGGTRSVAYVRTTGGPVVTSGLYERSFERDGKRYWHILDPRTGYPAASDIVSASIYSQESIDGDGYTKPLFMLGRQAALSFVEARPGLQAFLIDAQGNTWATSGSDFELI